MKTIDRFFAPMLGALFLVTSLFSCCFTEANAQITPPYYNPANVAITGGNINNTVIGGTTAAAGSFTTLSATGNAGSTVNITAAGANTPSHVLLRNTTAGGASPGLEFYNGDGYRHYIQEGIGTAGLNIVSVDGTPVNITSVTSVTNTTDSSSTTTGSLKTAGGLGVAKKSYFGDVLNVSQSDTYSTITSGTPTVILNNIDGTANNYTRIVHADNTGGTAAAIQGVQIIDHANNYGNYEIWTRGAKDANIRFTITSEGDIRYEKTITAPGTTGARTINKTTGRVNFAAAAASLVVTNSLVTANSIIHCTVATNDTTMKSAACVPAAGSFTIYSNAAATAETAVAFTVTN